MECNLYDAMKTE